MSADEPWTTEKTTLVHETPYVRVYQDQVIRPDGKPGRYDWVSAPDQVRVAAVVDGELLLIEQWHYLVGSMLQLPGGLVDADEESEAAARRELREETGYRDGVWTSRGYVHPLPGLTPVRIHLWQVQAPAAGTPSPEPSEHDLRVRHLPVAEAVRAVRDGAVRCAASAALILAVVRDLAVARDTVDSATAATTPCP
jgi:8-oxo-dGTP pyrophosphatase MutT (NUDIX family)